MIKDNITTITPPKRGLNFNLHELWESRELFYLLTIREIKLRYKQTLVGILWVVIQPLINTLVFTLILGRIAAFSDTAAPYYLFSLIGMAGWFFFLNGVNQAANSLVSNANLLKKIYFPRILLPLASITSGFIDLLINLALVFCILPFYAIPLSWNILLLPIPIFFLFLSSAAHGVLFAGFNGRYRDLRHILPFLMQLIFFISPIIYPLSILPVKWQPFYAINPLVGPIETIRWILLYSSLPFSSHYITISFTSTIVFFLFSVWSFRKLEVNIADVV